MRAHRVTPSCCSISSIFQTVWNPCHHPLATILPWKMNGRLTDWFSRLPLWQRLIVVFLFFLISRKSSGFFLPPPLKTTTWTANASSTIRQLTLGGNVHRGHVKLRNEHGQTGFFLFRLQKCGRNEGQSSQQRNIESDELSNSAVATAPTAKTTDGKWKWRKCDTHVKLPDELTGRDGKKKSRNYLMMTLPSTDQPGWRWSGNVGGGLKECSWP